MTTATVATPRWGRFVPLGAVVAVLVALLVAAVVRGSTSSGPTASPFQVPAPAVDAAGVVAAATSVPATVLDRVGTGGVDTVPIAINGVTVTANGHPRVLWDGTEWCAACAAMRWPLVVALSRFGTFSGLDVLTTPAAAPYPSIPTLTFRAARYSSDLLSFTAYETASTEFDGKDYRPLQQVTDADQALVRTYDAPPYFRDDPPAPFVLFAGQYATAGSLYTPGVFDGLSAGAVAAALGDPTSAVGTAVLGVANVLTAVLCVATGGRPGPVCTSGAVNSARDLLGVRSG